MNINGVLVVNKPRGCTSHDVILRVRKLLKIKKIGHTGTLDPAVGGVLPLCIGRATKIVEYLQEQPKTYIAEWTGGISTDTEDQTGNILERLDHVKLDQKEVEGVFRSFVGSYQQTPPMYSAVKVGGKRLYDLARKGEEVERPSRSVTIYEIEILDMNLEVPYPKVRFRVRCSKGTYIRTLCVDIGKALSIPAHMSDLVRIETASFTLKDAFSLEEIEKAVYDGNWDRCIIPLENALSFLPKVTVPEYMISKIINGQPILHRFPLPDLRPLERVQIVAPSGELLAIHCVIQKGEIFSKPEKILFVPE